MRFKNFSPPPGKIPSPRSSSSGDRPVLGRGLDSLFPPDSSITKRKKSATRLGIEQIEPNPNQPRKVFDKEFLKALSDSIKKNGLIQPIIVKKTGAKYQIVAGERRWRASAQAGLKEVPVRVLEKDSVFLPLVENLQRENLNPIELAQAYQKLLEEHKLTQKQLAQQLGLARATLANHLRILNLPREVRALILNKELSLAVAKILLQETKASAQIKWARHFAKNKTGVREAQSLLAGKKRKSADRTKKQKLWQTQALNKIQSTQGVKAKLKFQKKGGELRLRFFSDEELRHLMDLLLKARS